MMDEFVSKELNVFWNFYASMEQVTAQLWITYVTVLWLKWAIDFVFARIGSAVIVAQFQDTCSTWGPSLSTM